MITTSESSHRPFGLSFSSKSKRLGPCQASMTHFHRECTSHPSEALQCLPAARSSDKSALLLRWCPHPPTLKSWKTRSVLTAGQTTAGSALSTYLNLNYMFCRTRAVFTKDRGASRVVFYFKYSPRCPWSRQHVSLPCYLKNPSMRARIPCQAEAEVASRDCLR